MGSRVTTVAAGTRGGLSPAHVSERRAARRSTQMMRLDLAR
nr:hypothetical protein I308_04863 [Cryptococcus tetragattii IND107]